MLVSYWERGSGQEPEGGPHTEPDAYVVDHFSRAGTNAIVELWESSLLTPSIRQAAEGGRRPDLRGLDRDGDRRHAVDAEHPDRVRAAEEVRALAGARGRHRAGREVRLRLRRRDPHPHPHRLQRRPLAALHRRARPPAAAVGEGLRDGPAQPAVRPRDRRDHRRGARRRARGRVARLQEPRRLPLDGRRPRHGRQNGALQRGRRPRRRRLQHRLGRHAEETDAAVRGRRQPGRLPRLRLPRRAERQMARLRRLQPLQRRPRLRRGVGSAPADVGPRAGRLRLPRPHAADPPARPQPGRRRRLPPEGLRRLRLRRAVDDVGRRPRRLDARDDLHRACCTSRSRA